MGFIRSLKGFFLAGIMMRTTSSNIRNDLRIKTRDEESVEGEGKKDDEVVLNNVTNAIRNNESVEDEGKKDDEVVLTNVTNATRHNDIVKGDGKKDYEVVPNIVTNATTHRETVEGENIKDDEVVLNNVTDATTHKESVEGEDEKDYKVALNYVTNATRHEESVEGEGKKDDEVVFKNMTNATRHKQSVEGEGKKDDEVVLKNVTNGISLKSNFCEEVAFSGSSVAIFVGDGKNDDNGEEGGDFSSNNWNGKQVDSIDAGNCHGEQTYHDAKNGNGEQADNVWTESRRGRKRKNLQVTSNMQRVEMIDRNEMPVVQISGRVLRSRTVAVGTNLVENLNDVYRETDEGIDEVDKKKLKLEKVDDKCAEPIIKRKEKKKKKQKSPRGRPLKVSAVNTNTNVIITRNDEGLDFVVSLNIDTSLCNLKVESVVHEKKDIEKQIIDMIVRCGWKIEYVPRGSRDYNVPVYFNPEGEAHWSVIKAYKNLKERIDSDKANVVEHTGFIVIPDETLCKLFRVTTKKTSYRGINRCEGVEQKVPGRNRDCSKMTDDSNGEEKSKTGERINGRKRKSVPLQGRTKRQCALLARESWNRSMPDDDENEMCNRSCNLLSWMIDLRTVLEGAVVYYRDPIKGTSLLKGKVMRDGLVCYCCHEVHTLLGFQLHAGIKLGDPLKNLYLRPGFSLFHCMVNSWHKQVKHHKIGLCSVDVVGGDRNDDRCNICGDWGKLMCCDCCPSTFHSRCLDIENIPAGDWYCLYCTCKFCHSVGYEAISQDDGHHLITCQLCEAKFHSTCTDQTNAKTMNSTTLVPFCGSGCQKIFNNLQKIVGLKQELEGGLSWTILHCHDIGNDESLSDYPLKIECNAKLAVAHSVMNECFSRIVDARSQSEMVTNVTYNCGSNFRRLNYNGFHTFILEKGDEVVSAASIRFHGTQLAEMPFVATRSIYRRQGMTRKLLTVIEKVLSSMHIQKLIIPSVSDVMEMWKNSFGFAPLEETTRQEMKSMSIIAFAGTYVLQKSLPSATGTILSNIRDDLRIRTRDEESVEGEGKRYDEVVLNNVTNAIRNNESVEDEGKDDEVVLTNVTNATRHNESVEGDGKKDYEVVPNIVTNVTTHRETVEGENIKDDEVVLNNVTDVTTQDHDAKNGNREQADNVWTESTRGRKRKNLQVTSNMQRVEMIDRNEMPVVQISGRVLRSRTVAVGTNLVENLNDMDRETDEGIDEVDKKKLKLEKVDDKRAEPIIKRKEKKKKQKSPRRRIKQLFTCHTSYIHPDECKKN